METKNDFAVVVREEDTQEVLLKETFPDIADAEERQRELQESARPEGISTEVTIETGRTNQQRSCHLRNFPCSSSTKA